MTLFPRQENVFEAFTEEGRRRTEEEAESRQEQLRWLREYFADGRIVYLGGDKLTYWEAASGEVLMNSEFSEKILPNDDAMWLIGEEVARRLSFDSRLRMILGIPTT